ncbi:MAG: hypothetical protein Ta2B_22530 [Termitinemataceae bacterium]|nr:MAG: hypothetical protein Ta2B_22530 [Termitinemataceae bacterium]
MRLALLLFLSIYPIIGTIFFIKMSRQKLPYPVFLCAAACGVLSTVFAALLQGMLDPPEFSNRIAILYYIFVRISFSEEIMRVVVLFPFFMLYKKIFKSELTKPFAVICGLCSGLAFASVETALIAATNPTFILIRLITAAPLHGACGVRCAAAAFSKPFGSKNIRYFAGALILHAFYDAMLISGNRLFIAIAVMLTIAVLIRSVREGIRENINE